MTGLRPALGPAALLAACIAPNAASAEPAPAIDRLELRDLVEAKGLTGEGIRIAVLSEVADLDHPVLASSAATNWRFPAHLAGGPATAEEAAPLLTRDDWHGTHVASILAGACASAYRGVACGARLDIYDFGVYGDFFPDIGDAGEGAVEADFIARVARSLDDATRHAAPIANLSFNVEAPALDVVSPDGQARSIEDLVGATGMRMGELFARRDELAESGQIELRDRADWDYLSRIGEQHNDPPALVFGLLLPRSSEWSALAAAFARFQRSGGVVVIAESNNRFEDRSGVLNAMPAREDAVDERQWLSVVYVREEEGRYLADLNACGRQAARFCIAVLAQAILAAEPEGGMRSESGHSMAAPMVSGLIALILEKARRADPDYSASEALAVIRDTARTDFENYDPAVHGIGLLDPRAALEAVPTARTR